MRNSRSQLAQPAVPVRNVRSVVLGDISFKTWYPSFYPEALIGKDVDPLYICKSCFAYTNEVQSYLGHAKVCSLNGAPPGRLIYTKDNMSIYEIDGEEDKLFAQNLSLFAKLFLDNKSVFFDVVGFNYYLLATDLPPLGTTKDASSRPGGASSSSLPGPSSSRHTANGRQQQQQQQIVGFFSKEKLSWDLNNLACILVFPPWQRRALGKILMGASYALSRREGRIGGPEKPLSELGRRGYLGFWQARVAAEILANKNKAVFEVGELADSCAMVVDDVIVALREMSIVEKKRNGDIIVNKAKVKDWAARTRADLRSPVDEEAFIYEDSEQADEEEEEES